MKVKEIIKLISRKELLKLSNELQVDYKAKKLKGDTLLIVILYTLFSDNKFSLRKLQETYNKPTIQRKLLGNKKDTSINHSSFHYRLNNIDVGYFKNIYNSLVRKCKKETKTTKSKYDIISFDSTIVSQTSKLLNVGFEISKRLNLKHIKYTVAYTEVPEEINIYTKKSYTSENKALKETIENVKVPKKTIILFDRGLNDRNTFEEIDKSNYFITREKKGVRREVIETEEKNEETETLKIYKEEKAYLYSRKKEKTKTAYRLIYAKQKETIWDARKERLLKGKMKQLKHKGKTKEEIKKEMLEEELIFVTNLPSEQVTSKEITEIYKNRWAIEVFFKFIKQELNFSHLINRTENGIQVMMYITMIFALMLLLYKNKNNMQGYKYVKSGMLSEMEEEFYKYIIEESGGSYKKWLSSKKTFW